MTEQMINQDGQEAKQRAVKFRATCYGSGRIVILEIDRETDSSVFIGSKRMAKLSTYEFYSNTFEEAKKWLVAQADEKVRRARRQLELANADLGNAKGLKLDGVKVWK